MPENGGSRRGALRFILLVGVVSLFADMTYEGARGITGPYLSLLGASSATVGLVGGLGELVGYGLRLASGYLADRTRRYWPITLLGYGFNLLAVPMLALAGRWEVAAFLIVAERFGKAIRTPARDAMLSHATRQVGTGWGFALHEAMDQLGAVSGPLIVAATLFLQNRYQVAFGVLLVPAALALLVLAMAWAQYPDPQMLESATVEVRGDAGGKTLPRVFWWYALFTATSVAGFAHFQLIAYHFKLQAVVPDAQIPVFFAVAMGVDALVALVAGRWFDRKGLLTLTVVPALTLPLPFLVFSRAYHLVLPGVVLWGAVMGIQETIMRAAIAEIIPAERRGLAYGVFNTAYGVAWFLGSTVMGILYGVAIPLVILFVVILELVSLPLLYLVRRGTPAEGARPS